MLGEKYGKNSDQKIRKYLFCAFFIIIFFKMFLFSWDIPWQPKYQLFSVPAFAYPGGDARNIQMAAHCAREGFPYFGENDCLKKAKLVRDYYPIANVPVLNYPSLWVKLYSFFKNDSEQFFMIFWKLNAIFLILTILLFSFRYNYLTLPLFLFSPITLLAIERGNTDAVTFFFTFVPLMVFSFSIKLQSFFVGFASALKIFPIFGYLAFVNNRFPFMSRDAIWGGIFAVPLVALSFMELPQILDGTSKGFFVAYGLTSLKQAPYLCKYPSITYLIMILFVLLTIVTVIFLLKTTKINQEIDMDIKLLEANDLTILIVSISIYLFTFFLLTNWAYRLIFLIPTFLILSKKNSIVSRLVCLNIFAIFWIPFFPYGWGLQNLACFSLVILLSYFLIICLKFRNSGSAL